MKFSFYDIFHRFINSMDFFILFIYFALSIVGLVALRSAVGYYDLRFSAQIYNCIIAFSAMLFVSMLPPAWLKNFSLPFYIFGVFLLLCVEFFGETTKGATRWLSIGFTRIQPSEMLKIAVPMMLAWYFDKVQNNDRLHKRDFFIAFVILMVPFSLIILQPDLGTSLLVLASGFFVIYFAGLSFRIIVPIVVLVISLICILLFYKDFLCTSDVSWFFFHDYQKNRICTLLNPLSDPLGNGFHTIQSMIAIGSGGLYGKGYMQGTQSHLDFIPERMTDFIFAVFAEEFGLYGCVFLLIIYFLLILFGLKISMSAKTSFSRLLSASISMMFFVYVFVNIGMVTGILPVVGVPLPFMSYGGSAFLNIGISCGLLMNIKNESKTKVQRI
ncbi:rod shape-determining protein RodA [Candidatus Kinetoplastidibacterium crithidiae]|uniref:Peptidoglycan glycosyltransferase MrdB n=1 Tax=Candidatus Kinetoplastidibacterium crithidiae TCC036E TaxID=1208918 RepID=M1M777_9PROT|nr:rod shape determining protein RodA [Candidatus Kinetoplastibacterium crithidii (ex Angomonas deanei ATCC 30255)]AGF47940.1 rod shape determining protein RodA [Candidatus Kinetoplastibacterium crithidii TCC036E]